MRNVVEIIAALAVAAVIGFLFSVQWMMELIATGRRPIRMDETFD